MIEFDEIDSTSKEARRRFLAGLREPTWFFALRQTGGYGRRGRSWQHPSGNFAASLLLPQTGLEPVTQLSRLSFVVAVAIDSALQNHGVSAKTMSLKWPNDILIGAAKVSGQLLELVEQGNERALIIGIGINILEAPDVPEYPTAALSDVLPDEALPGARKLLSTLDREMQFYSGVLREQGFQPIRQRWLSRAGGIGGKITVRLPRESVTGVFEGIDESGALRIRLENGVRSITSGDVFFPVT